MVYLRCPQPGALFILWLVGIGLDRIRVSVMGACDRVVTWQSRVSRLDQSHGAHGSLVTGSWQYCLKAVLFRWTNCRHVDSLRQNIRICDGSGTKDLPTDRPIEVAIFIAVLASFSQLHLSEHVEPLIHIMIKDSVIIIVIQNS